MDIADAAELAIADAGSTVKGHSIQIARADDGCTDAEKASSVARMLIADSAIAGVMQAVHHGRAGGRRPVRSCGARPRNAIRDPR